MTREEIISGLKFTVEMVLLDPSTGETFTEPRNDMDKITLDACRGAIELLEQEPCADAISRQAVEKITWEEPSYSDALNVLTEVRDKVRALPPVTPKEKTGHWIVGESEFNINVKCSCCNYIVNYFWSDWNKANYCPNCGAKMESEE